MKKYLLLLAIGLLSVTAMADSLGVVSIDELTNDISARTNLRLDENSQPCAILRVQIPSLAKLDFSESSVGNVKSLPGEYQFYIKHDSPTLIFTHKGNKQTIKFSDYGIAIEGKKSYKIVLSMGENTEVTATTSTHITANKDNVVVLVDGVPVGETPLHISGIVPGEHTISVPNRNGVTMADSIVNINAGENSITLALHEESPKPVTIDWATPGGDTGGWYVRLGINESHDGDKKGIADYEGNQIVPNEYDYVSMEELPCNYIVVGTKKNPDSGTVSVGLYDPQKGLVIDTIYDNIYIDLFDKNNAVINVCKNRKWGVIDITGSVIVPIEYNNPVVVNRMNRTLSAYKDIKNSVLDQYDIFDEFGKELLSVQALRIGGMNENGLCLFKDNKGCGIMTVDGSIQYLPEQYEIVWPRFISDVDVIGNNLFAVKDKSTNKLGFMNTNMELAIPTKYDYDEYVDTPIFRNGVALVKENNTPTVINKLGNTILKGGREILFIEENDERMMIHQHNHDYTSKIYDLSGNPIIPYEYSHCDVYFDNNEPIYVIGNKVDETEDRMIYQNSIIDKDFNIIVELPEDFNVKNISDGFIQVVNMEDGLFGYLNISGDILTPCIYGYDTENLIEYDEETGELTYPAIMYNFVIDGEGNKAISDGLAMLVLGDRYGFIDNKGRVVVPMEYTAATPFENGVAYVRNQNGKWKKLLRNRL